MKVVKERERGGGMKGKDQVHKEGGENESGEGEGEGRKGWRNEGKGSSA